MQVGTRVVSGPFHKLALSQSSFACARCNLLAFGNELDLHQPRYVNAPRANVFRAILGARAVATWMAPTGMTIHVYAFDAGEAGSFGDGPGSI